MRNMSDILLGAEAIPMPIPTAPPLSPYPGTEYETTKPEMRSPSAESALMMAAEVRELREVAQVLQRRLVDVLRPDSPVNEATPGGGAISIPCSPFVSVSRGLTAEIVGVKLILARLIERLEV